MFQFNCIHSPNFSIDENIVKNIFQTTESTIKKAQNGTINIVFVTPEEIQNLNKNYRKKDAVTDVLSFHYFDDFENIPNDEISWELIFCEEKIVSQWQEYWLGSEKEFYKLLIHSLLHILWYDHEAEDEYKKMQTLENTIWNKIFEKNKEKWYNGKNNSNS